MKKYLAALIAMLVCTPSYAHTPNFYEKNSIIYNKTLADWSVGWRQWADSMPAKKHPLFDTAPCSEGNSGPVWFLGGRFCAIDINPACENAPAVRTCEVPQGVSLYFPVLNTSCLDREAENGFCLEAGPSIPEMKKVVADLINRSSNLEVTLDGKRISNLHKDFRVQTNAYISLLPDGNLYQALGEPAIKKGSYVGVDDGIYVMLKPPSKGNHVLNFRGTFPSPFNFDLDFTYHLVIR